MDNILWKDSNPVYNGRVRFHKPRPIQMHQTFQNSINVFFYSLDSSVSYRVSFHGQSIRENATAWLSDGWECLLRRTVDNGFAPVNEVLKTVSFLWYEIWGKKWKAAENIGSILKLGLELSSWHRARQAYRCFFPADLYWHTIDVKSFSVFNF